MRIVVFVFVVVACHYAVPSLRQKVAQKTEKVPEEEPMSALSGEHRQPPVEKFAETLRSVESVAERMGVDNFRTKSIFSKVSLNTLACAISRHLKADAMPQFMFKLEALDKVKKYKQYGTDFPITNVAEFLIFPDDLVGLTLDDEIRDIGEDDEESGNEIIDRLSNPCLHVEILQDTLNQIVGKVDWIDSRCQSGNAMMKLADNLFQCFGVEEASLNNISSIECGKNGKRVHLSLLRTLTHGQTWYQKFGYQSVRWEGQDLEDVATLQEALHDVSFEELRDVWKKCGKTKAYEKHSRQTFEELSQRISSFFLEHESLLKSETVSLGSRHNGTVNAPAPGTIGYFANWLVSSHCEHAQEVLDSTLVFPCKEAYQNSYLKSLEDEDADILADVNSFAGAMAKHYNGS